MSHIVFVLVGYEREEAGQLINHVQVEVFETSVEKAIEKAKKLIDKPFWKVRMIIEKEGE